MNTKQLISLIKEDWRTHDRNIHSPGLHALAVARFGQWRMGFPSLVRKPLSALYRYLERRVRRWHGIELPYSTEIGRNVKIEHQNGIIIHGNAVLKDGVTIRQGVTIGARYTDDDRRFEAPYLGYGADIGAGAMILGKVRIGDHAKVGAMSLVLDDVPNNAVAIGQPVKVVSDPFKKMRESNG